MRRSRHGVVVQNGIREQQQPQNVDSAQPAQRSQASLLMLKSRSPAQDSSVRDRIETNVQQLLECFRVAYLWSATATFRACKFRAIDGEACGQPPANWVLAAADAQWLGLWTLRMVSRSAFRRLQ